MEKQTAERDEMDHVRRLESETSRLGSSSRMASFKDLAAQFSLAMTPGLGRDRLAHYQEQLAEAPPAARRHLVKERKAHTWTCGCGQVVEPHLAPLGNATFDGYRLRLTYRPERNCPECGMPRIEERGAERVSVEVDIGPLLARAGLIGRARRQTLETFERGLQDDAFETCRRYADVVIAGLNSPNWLVLWGFEGSGKSHLAAAVIRAYIEDRIKRDGYALLNNDVPPAMLVGWSALIERTKRSFDLTNQEKQREASALHKLWSGMARTRVLALDDLDKVSATPWSIGQLYVVIEARSQRELPTIITCNTDPSNTDPVSPDQANLRSEWLGAIARAGKSSDASEYTVRSIFDRIDDNLIKIVKMHPVSYRQMRRQRRAGKAA